LSSSSVTVSPKEEENTIIIMKKEKNNLRKIEKIYKTIKNKNFISRNNDVSVLVVLVLLLQHSALVLVFKH
jgi:hypothetical protein